MKILILGGYGTFGGRLAYLLAGDERVELLIAGRSIEKAREFCQGLPRGAGRHAVFFDRNSNVESQIRQIGPALIVDASGPFQAYGADPYRVVAACIVNGISYMDLADGSDFVNGISRFDADCKAKNIFVLSGVSSFPVLTAAVVRRLARGMLKVNSIKGGIAPSPFAGVGLNVVRAVAGYAGKPVRLIRDGKHVTGYALTETMRYTVCPPGHLPLNNTLFSLVDVPDLRVLPELWPELETLWLGAGPVPEILHRGLIALAWLVRSKIVPSLLPLAPLFHSAINVLRWGPHRGGMFVSVQGQAEGGQRVERSWHLLAEKGDGPLIPSMAVAALILHALSGRKPAPGARPATQELELEDYEELFKQRAIHTGQRENISDVGSTPLYRRILNARFDELPKALAELHNLTTKTRTAEGLASVDTGKGFLARVIRRSLGFPEAGREVPVSVTFRPIRGGELWLRNFGGKRFSSFQWEGTGCFDRLLVEKFGPVTVALALVWDQDRLQLVLRHWRIFGIPLPMYLAPGGETYEYAADGRFHFHVEIKHWLTGLIVKYEGQLHPTD